MGLIIEPRQGNEHHTINAHQWKSLICIWVLFAATCVVMILRLVSQLGIMRIVRADDILMIIAWILQAANTIVSTVSVYYGLGRHNSQLSGPDAFVKLVKLEMFSLIAGSLSGLFGRVAFAVFLLYFIRRVSRPRTYIIWIIIVVQIVVNISFPIYNFVKCAPSDYDVNGVYELGSCWLSGRMMVLQYVQGAINALSNICLTFLALSLVLQIHAPGYAKATLGFLLSLSLVATISQIVDIVKVRGSADVGADYAYRLNVWNYWYSVENAVIIITSSLPLTRPVLMAMHRKLKKSRLIQKCKKSSRNRSCIRCFRVKGHQKNMQKTSSPLPSIRGHVVLDDESKLHESKPNACGSIYHKDFKNTYRNYNNHTHSVDSYQPKKHRRHFSGKSGGTFSLSSFSRSSHHSWQTTTRFDDMDLSSFDYPFSTLSNDFVPTASPRLTHQTVISAGDLSIPPSFNLPLIPPPAITPTTSPPPNGSGRSSRNSRIGDHVDAGFTASKSSLMYLPVIINNKEGSSTRRRRHQSPSPGPLPIVSTTHFTIEYGDDHDNHDSATSNTITSCGSNGNRTGNHNRNATGEFNEHDFGRGWTNSPHFSQSNRSSTYNEDDANALQLHDVGSILKNSQSNQH